MNVSAEPDGFAAFETWLAPDNFDSAGRQIAGLTELRAKREKK